MSPTGHLAIGFAVKKWDAKVPLVWYLAGATVIDLIYMGLSFLGLEGFGNNPWSHSLLMAFVWSALATTIVWLVTKHVKSAWLMGFVVFSHWILDFIVWDNLPLAFAKNPVLGLGFYNFIGFDLNALTLNFASILATGLELTLLVVGIVVYFSARKQAHSNQNSPVSGSYHTSKGTQS